MTVADAGVACTAQANTAYCCQRRFIRTHIWFWWHVDLLRPDLLIYDVRCHPSERQAAKHPHVDTHPQGPHIHFKAGLIARCEALWAAERWCAETWAVAHAEDLVATCHDAATKVRNLDFVAVAVQQEVGWFEVSMHNLVVVKIV